MKLKHKLTANQWVHVAGMGDYFRVVAQTGSAPIKVEFIRNKTALEDSPNEQGVNAGYRCRPAKIVGVSGYAFTSLRLFTTVDQDVDIEVLKGDADTSSAVEVTGGNVDLKDETVVKLNTPIEDLEAEMILVKDEITAVKNDLNVLHNYKVSEVNKLRRRWMIGIPIEESAVDANDAFITLFSRKSMKLVYCGINLAGANAARGTGYVERLKGYSGTLFPDPPTFNDGYRPLRSISNETTPADGNSIGTGFGSGAAVPDLYYFYRQDGVKVGSAREDTLSESHLKAGDVFDVLPKNLFFEFGGNEVGTESYGLKIGIKDYLPNANITKGFILIACEEN